MLYVFIVACITFVLLVASLVVDVILKLKGVNLDDNKQSKL